MKTCPYCAEEIQEAAVFCKHCKKDVGTDATRPVTPEKAAPASPSKVRQGGRNPLMGIAGPVIGFGLIVGVAYAAFSGMFSSNCEPQSMVEWVDAHKRGCLTKAYVCENLSLNKISKNPAFLRDLANAGVYGQITSGDFSTMFGVVMFVEKNREKFGCPPDEPLR